MKSTQLKTFLAVATERSFSKAARRVHVSQSTASLHVKELEDEVGALLLERAADGVRPTPAGQVILTYAERLLGLEQEALAQVRVQAAVPAGVVRIAASSVPAEVHLPPMLSAWRRQGASVEVVVRVSSSAAAVTALKLGDCDVALVGTRTDDADLAFRPFADDEIVLVGAVELPEPRGSFPWIAREPGSGTRAASASLLPPGHRPALTVASAEAMRQCVLHGAGYAFLSRAVVAEDVAAGRLRICPWPGTPLVRHLYVAHRAGTAHSPAVEALLALL